MGSSKGVFCSTNRSELRLMAGATTGAAADAVVFESFCTRYFGAVYGVIRLRNAPESSLELTQQFFLKQFVEKNVVAKFDPERGSFRNWLWRKIQWFLRDEHDRRVNHPALSAPYDVEEAEHCHQRWAQRDADEHTHYERQYAAALARDALRAVHLRWQEKLNKRGTQVDAHVVVSWLVDRDYLAIARSLGVSPTVARKTVQRLNEDLWKELATRVRETVSSVEDFAAEFAHVCSAIGIAPPARLLAP